MDAEPYSNREIREMFGEMKLDLTEIKAQTKLTNGRVSKLENWRWFITGATTMITIVVIPLLGWALWVLSNIQGQVNAAVHTALSAYDITQQK